MAFEGHGALGADGDGDLDYGGHSHCSYCVHLVISCTLIRATAVDEINERDSASGEHPSVAFPGGASAVGVTPVVSQAAEAVVRPLGHLSGSCQLSEGSGQQAAGEEQERW